MVACFLKICQVCCGTFCYFFKFVNIDRLWTFIRCMFWFSFQLFMAALIEKFDRQPFPRSFLLCSRNRTKSSTEPMKTFSGTWTCMVLTLQWSEQIIGKHRCRYLHTTGYQGPEKLVVMNWFLFADCGIVILLVHGGEQFVSSYTQGKSGFSETSLQLVDNPRVPTCEVAD